MNVFRFNADIVVLDLVYSVCILWCACLRIGSQIKFVALAVIVMKATERGSQ